MQNEMISYLGQYQNTLINSIEEMICFNENVLMDLNKIQSKYPKMKTVRIESNYKAAVKNGSIFISRDNSQVFAQLIIEAVASELTVFSYHLPRVLRAFDKLPEKTKNNIILTGSCALKLMGLIEREPRDIDFAIIGDIDTIDVLDELRGEYKIFSVDNGFDEEYNFAGVEQFSCAAGKLKIHLLYPTGEDISPNIEVHECGGMQVKCTDVKYISFFKNKIVQTSVQAHDISYSDASLKMFEHERESKLRKHGQVRPLKEFV